jgi:hypothetical protein
MRTLTVKLGTAISLTFVPAAQAACKIVPPTEYQAPPESNSALLPEKSSDGHTEAMLEVACAPKGQQLSVSTSADLRDTLQVRYRIDGPPQKQSTFAVSGTNTISIDSLPPAEIGFAKKLSIEFVRREGPPLLFLLKRRVRTAPCTRFLAACRIGQHEK